MHVWLSGTLCTASFYSRRIVEEKSWQRAKVALRPTSSSLGIWPVKPSCLWSSWRETDRGREWLAVVLRCVCLCVCERLSIRLHLCLALAVQYFSAWSGSLTSPSLQHWPHTNFIISSSLWPLTSAFPVPCTGPMFPFVSSVLIGLFDLAAVILFGECEATTAGWWKHNINTVEKCFIKINVPITAVYQNNLH